MAQQLDLRPFTEAIYDQSLRKKRSRVGVRSHPLSNSMSKGMSAIAIWLSQEGY